MSVEDSGDSSPKQTDFEAEFRLLPLGQDAIARLDRLERILGRYLSAAIDGEHSFTSLRAEGMPIPNRESVDRILDDFRDPEEVRARRDYELANPDLNQG